MNWWVIINQGMKKLNDMSYRYTHWGDKTSDLSRYPQLTIRDIELASKYSVGDIIFNGKWTLTRTWG